MTKVKICGITNLDDALSAAKLGADMLGFNFYEKSPRFIEPHLAQNIWQLLTKDILKVGVFVNSPVDRILEIARRVNLDLIQLHGDEDAAFANQLRAKTRAAVIKAFRISKDFDPNAIAGYELSGVLLDAFSPGLYGGTGDTFDWKSAKIIKDLSPVLYLAGGLTSDNVADAIRFVRPYAVDVASGVESAPGRKDPKKLEAFIRNAKNA